MEFTVTFFPAQVWTTYVSTYGFSKKHDQNVGFPHLANLRQKQCRLVAGGLLGCCEGTLL